MSSICRICSAPLSVSFCDLGNSPLSNSYLTREALDAGRERAYPLHAYVCSECKLVQVEAMESPEHIFSDYLYFSSYSSSWVEHARRYAEKMIERFDLLPQKSLVMEIASNDGYLLQHFVAKGIAVLGVEPAANVAKVAREKGVRTEVCFFGRRSAQDLVNRYGPADVIAGNNVIAHVPDLHDFIGGVKIALAPGGIATFEFPHLLRLIRETQFDTIYHEHFSYFALAPLSKAFEQHDLEIVDVEELPTHGGSLRVYVTHAALASPLPSVAAILGEECAAGLDRIETYTKFQATVDDCRDALVRFLHEAKHAGKTVAGYGAPAKGNTLLNYCGIDSRTIDFTVDLNPHKQGHFLPGSHIPILAPEKIFEKKPDILLVLPWNLTREVREQMSGISAWGGRFAVAIPRTRILE